MKTKSSIITFLLMCLVIGASVALFFNWGLSFFIDWPVTVGNWAKTWLGLILINIIFSMAKDG